MIDPVLIGPVVIGPGEIDRELAVRALALYGPVALALVFALWRRPERRLAAGLLLSTLWTLPMLLALQALNRSIGWWTFATRGPALLGMPVELYLGWCCLWGAVPVLALRSASVAWSVTLMVALDLAVMPLCTPVLRLGPKWLVGEAVAAAIILAPALFLARWTTRAERVGSRAALQALIALGLFLFALPEMLFAVLGRPLAFALHGWRLSPALQMVALIALPAASAVQEFAERGRGTPIPYDPPQHLVTCGIYRYIANPMQACTVAILAMWALVLGTWWLAVAAVMAWCYGVGLARWDEASDLRLRFGDDWLHYRTHVHDWRLRWRPHTAGKSATLYIAHTCGPCSELARWFLARHPLGLHLAHAECYPGEPLRRLRYQPADGTSAEDGVRAFARALEHLHLGWALAGAAIRLPVVREALQLLLDAVGFGERALPASQIAKPTSAADDADRRAHAPCS